MHIRRFSNVSARNSKFAHYVSEYIYELELNSFVAPLLRIILIYPFHLAFANYMSISF